MRRVVKPFLLAYVLLIFSVHLNAQNHVSWNAFWDKKNEEVVIIGTIEPTWHLYSPKTDPDLGPIPLRVSFEKTKGLKQIGSLVFLTPAVAHQDDNFGGTVYIWENKVEMRQRFRIKKAGVITLTLNYMICDETKCIPPIDVPLTIRLN